MAWIALFFLCEIYRLRSNPWFGIGSGGLVGNAVHELHNIPEYTGKCNSDEECKHQPTDGNQPR